MNQGINMLDTSPPRGNAFVTPGNIFLRLGSSLGPFLSFIHFFSRPRRSAPFYSPPSLCLSIHSEVRVLATLPSPPPGRRLATAGPFVPPASAFFFYTSPAGVPAKYVPEFS